MNATIKTEAAIWAEGTEFTRDDLVRLYEAHVSERDACGDEPCSPSRFFGSLISNTATKTDGIEPLFVDPAKLRADCDAVIEAVESAHLSHPADVADAALDILAESGRDAALAEVRRAATAE